MAKVCGFRMSDEKGLSHRPALGRCGGTERYKSPVEEKTGGDDGRRSRGNDVKGGYRWMDRLVRTLALFSLRAEGCLALGKVLGYFPGSDLASGSFG